MTNYEIMFIVKPDLEEAAIKKEAENLKKVLTNHKCKMVEEKAIGQKELAYEIKKYKNGYYFLFVVEVPEANNDAIMFKAVLNIAPPSILLSLLSVEPIIAPLLSCSSSDS